MEKISDIIEKLRNGEDVTCLECEKGKYTTSLKSPEDIKTCNYFRCNNCGSVVHCTPADVIVE